MVDADTFSDDQRQFLSLIVADLNGPTCVSSLLRVIEDTLYALKPEWELDRIQDGDLRRNLEVCLAALQYMKVKNVSEQA